MVSKTGKKNGRPTKMTEEKIKQLKAVCRLKPTLADCGAFLDVDATTIEKWIKRTHGIAFSVFREQNMVQTRFMIVRNILKECEKGNTTMLIYASKNLCGWKDRYDNDMTSETKIIIEKSDDGLK